MTIDVGVELAQKRTEQEKLASVKFQVGTLEDGRPEYLVLPRERVVAGDLARTEALGLLFFARHGVHDMITILEKTGDILPSHPSFPAHSAAEMTIKVYELIGKEIGKLKSEGVTAEDEREIIKGMFGAYTQAGIISMDQLIRAAEAKFLVTQREEKGRQASVEKGRRLFRLGFVVGFAGSIVNFRTSQGEYINFPYTNFALPEAERWPDVERRAVEAGFTFDQKGRVAGFQTSDDELIEIPETDRGQQLRMR